MHHLSPILTFDIEDWFHVLDHPSSADVHTWDRYASHLESSVDLILEILARHDQQATMFCLGWVAERYPAVLRRIVDAGHEVGSHSYDHGLVHRRTPADFRADLRRSIDVLQQVAGVKVTTFRASGFSVTRATPWVFEELLQSGIVADSSVFPGTHAHGGIEGVFPQGPCRITSPSGTLLEFPISTMRVGPATMATVGGGYFRLLPLSLMLRTIRRGGYTMAYLHPHDLDARVPVLEDLPVLRRLRSMIGRNTAAMKLDRILSDTRFVTMDEAVKRTRWEDTPVIDLVDLSRG